GGDAWCVAVAVSRGAALVYRSIYAMQCAWSCVKVHHEWRSIDSFTNLAVDSVCRWNVSWPTPIQNGSQLWDRQCRRSRTTLAPLLQPLFSFSSRTVCRLCISMGLDS